MAKSVKKTRKTAESVTHSKAATDPTKHFSYLASSEDDGELLCLIFDKCKVLVKNGILAIQLKKGFTIEGTHPAKAIPANAPKTFRAVLKKHASLALKHKQDIILELANHGVFDTATLQLNESPILDFAKNSRDLIFPLAESQDCWVYNRNEKNASGEPVIYFVSHDTLNPTKPRECNIGSLFLQRCAEIVGVITANKEVSETKGTLKVIGTKSALFKNTRLAKLPDGRIMLIGNKTIAWLRLEKRFTFSTSHSSEFPLDYIGPEYNITCQVEGNQAILVVDHHGIFLIDVSADRPIYLSTLVDNLYGGTCILLDHHLIYYQDGFDENPSGFRIVSLKKSNDTAELKTRERLRLTSAICYDDHLIFAGQDQILGFSFSPKLKKLNRAFKLRADFVSPIVETAPEKNYLLVFDSGTTAITIFRCEKGLKRISAFHENFNALQWCWVDSQLYVILHDHQHFTHFIGKYQWAKGALKMKKLVELNLINPTSKSNWVWPMCICVQSDLAFIINADGIVWEVPVE